MTNENGNNNGKSPLNMIQYIIVAIVLAAVIISAVCFLLAHNDYQKNNEKTTDVSTTVKDTASSTNEEETSPAEETTERELSEKYTVINKLSKEINRGSLILVSNAYNYVAPEKSNLIKIYGNKSKNYTLSSTEIMLDKEAFDAFEEMMADFTKETGLYDVIITSAYRSPEDQEALYNKAVKADGENQKYASKPNAGDTQTGLGLDIKAYSGGVMKKIAEDKAYSWIIENFYKYGFIERYPSSKSDITDIEYSGGLYLRYVGKVHSYAMKASGQCLEEYVLSLKDYTYDGEHLTVDVENTVYEIYYAKAEEGKTSVDIYVPAEKPYTVFGTNVDGFAVVFEK